MFEALTYVGYSVGILLILTVLFIVEDRKGTKVVAVRVRNVLDAVLGKLAIKGSTHGYFFGKGFARLVFHYSMHGVLKRFLQFLKKWEQRVETMLHRNRTVAKQIQGEKQRTHLDEIADHKSETALTDSEKEQLRSHDSKE